MSKNEEIDVYDPRRLSNLMTGFIILANLFGSGKRDSSGYTTQEEFIAKRGDVTIDYDESSGEMYSRGHLIVSRKGTSVLSAVRGSEGKVVDAGFPSPLGYKLKQLNLPEAEGALRDFCKGLEPICQPGDQIPIPREVLERMVGH